MKQELTITINVPEGLKAYWDGNSVVYVDYDDNLTELPDSWEVFCGRNNIHNGEAYINSFSFAETSIEKPRTPHFDKNYLPDKESANRHLALMQLHQLRDCYRQGWKPDWSDDNVKFIICQGDKDACVIKTRYHSSAFLSFQSEKIAELFLANFQDLIRATGDLI